MGPVGCAPQQKGQGAPPPTWLVWWRQVAPPTCGRNLWALALGCVAPSGKPAQGSGVVGCRVGLGPNALAANAPGHPQHLYGVAGCLIGAG